MSPNCLLLPLALAAGTLFAPAPPGDPVVRWEAPTSFVEGLSFEVAVEVEAPADGATIPGWMFTPAAFSIDGKPLGERKTDGGMQMPPGFKITGRIDLGPYLKGRDDFELTYAGKLAKGEPVRVHSVRRAAEGLDFMALPAEQLGGYRVLLRTNRGDVLVKPWPDVAPQHVRNFLDLAYTGFYDGTKFHRVIEGFMIQGGDPTGSGSGSGPRQLPLEASERPHVRGVLSMARAQDPNSASCQFFIMHGNARHLDGQYSGFGEVVSGMAAVDAIATSPTGRQGSENSSPLETQMIERALVVLAPPQEQK